MRAFSLGLIVFGNTPVILPLCSRAHSDTAHMSHTEDPPYTRVCHFFARYAPSAKAVSL